MSIEVDLADLTVVGILTVAEVSLALVAVHVAAKRNRPAYNSKNYGLSLLTALAGMVFNLGVAKRYGMWAALTEAAEPPFGCIMEAWVLWTGLAGLLACVFLRVYRNHSVLVRHDGFMWALPLQLATLMIPFLVPPVFITVNASTTVAFDEDTQECERQSDTLEAFTIAAVSILTIAVVALTFRLRAVKLQAPEEFNAALATSVVLLFATILLPLLHKSLEGDRDERRRAMVTVSALATIALTACPLWDPIKGFIMAYEEAMKARGEFGFDRSQHPGDTLKISQDRMKINALASSPGSRDIPESSAMACFFRDSLDRETLRDPYLLQASTMRILDRYIREGAPMFISLSESCREDMLASKASNALIFESARQEVMEYLGGNKVTYCASPSDTDTSEGSIHAGSSGLRADPGTSVQGVRAGISNSPLGRPFPKIKSTHKKAAAVSGRGALERHGMGPALGDTGECSAAFGLRPGAKRIASGFENGPAREKRAGLFIGRRGVAAADGEGSAGGSGYGSGSDASGGGGRADPFEDGRQPRQHQYPETEAVGVETSLDDLDPFMGLQGTLEYNYAQSLASIAGLEEAVVASEAGGVNLMGKTTFSDVHISGSSSEDDGRKQDEPQVINPMFGKPARRTFPRRKK